MIEANIDIISDLKLTSEKCKGEMIVSYIDNGIYLYIKKTLVEKAIKQMHNLINILEIGVIKWIKKAGTN